MELKLEVNGEAKKFFTTSNRTLWNWNKGSLAQNLRYDASNRTLWNWNALDGIGFQDLLHF